MKFHALMTLAAGLSIALGNGRALAHHSFSGEFDVARALTLRGIVVSVELRNPHSFIYLDVRTGQEAVERWALEGPSATQIARMGLDRDVVRVGDEIGVCGYATREAHTLTRAEPATGRAVRLLSAAVLMLPHREPRLWSNYRQGGCGLDR